MEQVSAILLVIPFHSWLPAACNSHVAASFVYTILQWTQTRMLLLLVYSSVSQDILMLVFLIWFVNVIYSHVSLFHALPWAKLFPDTGVVRLNTTTYIRQSLSLQTRTCCADIYFKYQRSICSCHDTGRTVNRVCGVLWKRRTNTEFRSIHSLAIKSIFARTLLQLNRLFGNQNFMII